MPLYVVKRCVFPKTNLFLILGTKSPEINEIPYTLEVYRSTSYNILDIGHIIFIYNIIYNSSLILGMSSP